MNQPILVGCGQLVDRPDTLEEALSPLAMMVTTAQDAARDAGLKPGTLANLDTVVAVGSVGPKLYENPAAELAQRLGATGADCYVTGIGGNTPQALVNHFAAEIARGNRSLVLLSGAEALDSLARAAKTGVELGWAAESTTSLAPQPLWSEPPGSNPTERAHGMVAPIVTYPLFENALRRHYGRTNDAHRQALGELFAPFTEIARDNPYAWFPVARSAEEIATPTPTNRTIGFPYTKYMNAVMQVNQSASVLLTSEDNARALGIDESRWVYLHGHCDLNDIWWVSERTDFHSSPALEWALASTFELAGLGSEDMAWFDIYSCFPAVVEITRDALKIPERDPRPLSITGGLPYFGGAGNNYTMHAIATGMARLRDAPGTFGLVTGNGWYLTKHSIGLYGTGRPDRPFSEPDKQTLTARVKALQHPVLDPEPSGRGTVETFTVLFDRDGQPERGLVLGHLDSGRRFIAQVDEPAAVLAEMTVDDPIGRVGRVSAGDPVNRFRFES